MIGFPIVFFLKCLRSDNSRHGNFPSLPMTPFLSIATIIEMIISRLIKRQSAPGLQDVTDNRPAQNHRNQNQISTLLPG